VDGAVEPPVGRHQVVVVGLDRSGQMAEVVELLVGDAGRRPLGGLAGQRAEDGEVVEDVARREPDHGDAAAGGNVDEPLVGQLEQGLPDGGAAGAELDGQCVEIEAGAGGQGTGQDPVAQLLRSPAAYGSADAGTDM
jgi:hypothetical protein